MGLLLLRVVNINIKITRTSTIINSIVHQLSNKSIRKQVEPKSKIYSTFLILKTIVKTFPGY